MMNISEYSLLKHPFYRAWEMGTVPHETLQTYAGQYFHHVTAFPRYLSALHTQIEDIGVRQILLDNLVDEERGAENHPELWLRFCDALGVDRSKVPQGEALAATRHLVDTFFALCRKSPASGLGALFAYESQVPGIAEFKLAALKKFYVSEDKHDLLKFFDVHRVADQYHTQALTEVFEKMSPADRAEAEDAARTAAQALWGFLDGMTHAMAA